MARISNEKLEALKKRARGVGRRGAAIARDAKPTAIAAVVGGAAAELARIAEEKVEALRDNWWATPAIAIVAGHLLRKKSQAAGLGLAGAGAAMLARAYRDSEEKDDSEGAGIGTHRRADAGALAPARAAALLAARSVFQPAASTPRRSVVFGASTPTPVPASRRRSNPFLD